MGSRIISGTLGGISLGDDEPTRILGVINLTKSSFYSGSVMTSNEEIINEGVKMQKDGADFIDVGARSTAPYRQREVSEETEKRLLTNAIRLLSRRLQIPISADTTRYEVAKSAIASGAKIVNNVYGLTQRDAKSMAHLLSLKDCSLLLTAHERSAKRLPDPINRVTTALRVSLKLAKDEGMEESDITIDPGIGFFSDKTISNVEWNCSVLSLLPLLRIFGSPICVGVSRKRFIGKLLGDIPPEERLNGSISATAIAVFNGAHIIRTHDVKPTAEAVKIAQAIREKGLRAKS